MIEFSKIYWNMVETTMYTRTHARLAEVLMAQVTLYLDNETAAKMRSAAQAAGMSQSRWVSDLIRQKTTGEWPDSIKELAGAWKDFPDQKALRETAGADLERELL